MKILKTVLWSSMIVAPLGVLGCDVFVSGRQREEPVYVQQQPQYERQQPQYVIVQEAPPPMIVESRPYAPSGAHVWIDGYWHWDSQRYSWQAGRYVVPPQADMVWVAPRYEREAKGYRYTQGRWQKQEYGNGHANERDH